MNGFSFITAAEPAATPFGGRYMDRKAFRAHLRRALGGESPLYTRHRFTGAPYTHVEYISSPKGLIILAHHDTIAGQIDGIHPATISSSIDKSWNIVEPLPGYKGRDSGYNLHWMTRKSQGSLILKAFGVMVGQRDPRAPVISTEGRFSLEIHDTAHGVVVAVFDSRESDKVFMIEPNAEAAREAA